MPMTPEQAQKLTALNRRVLANVAAGRQSHEGITKEELTEAVDILRGDRAKAMASAVASGKKKAAKAEPKSSGSLEDKLKSKFGNLDLD